MEGESKCGADGGGQGKRDRKVLLKMAVCKLMELALGEDIGNAEEGRTTAATRRCRQRSSWRLSSVRRGGEDGGL